MSRALSEAVDPAVQREVMDRLRAIAEEENVWIVYAVESGSRAWGFASTDSDYDVRFLYVRPHDWYLSIDADTRRDVIERPIVDDLDLSGWDLKKALMLFRKSNPPLLEWLQSPLIYIEDGSVIGEIQSLLEDYYSPRACFYHYFHMARGNFKSYLQSDDVQHKKYLYVLRPLLACRWIAAGRGPVPMEFSVLVQEMLHDAHVLAEVEDLLGRKKAGTETGRGARMPAIHQFVEGELERLESEAKGLERVDTPLAPLNDVLRRAVTAFPKR